MSNKKISDLTAAALALQDDDLIEGEFAAGGTSRKFTGLEVRTVEMEERIEADEKIYAAVGLDEFGDFVPYSGTNYIDASETIAGAIALLDDAVGELAFVSQGDLYTLNVANGLGGWVSTGIEVIDSGSGLNVIKSKTEDNYLFLNDLLVGFVVAPAADFAISSDVAVLKNSNATTFVPVGDDSLVNKVYVDSRGSVGDEDTINTSDGAGTWKETGLEIDINNSINTIRHKVQTLNAIEIGTSSVGITSSGGFAIKSDDPILQNQFSGTFTPTNDEHLVTKAYVDKAASTGGGVGGNNAVVITTNYSATIDDKYILSSNAGGNVEVQLPTINTLNDKILTLTLRKFDGGAFALTVVRGGSDVIWFDGVEDADGITTVVQGAWVTLVSGDGAWYVVQGGADWEEAV